MNKKDIINLSISILLIFSIGLFTGFSIGYFQAKTNAFPDILEVEEINPGISTLKFMELKGGKLIGKVDGRAARIAYSPDHIYDLQVGESFEIPIYQVNLGAYYIAEDLPEDTLYIASSQGKYFYHILDPRAFKITPKNRLYFETEDEALKKGYLPPK